MDFTFTPEEIALLSYALYCYEVEIANEEEDDYPIFLKLRKEFQEAKAKVLGNQ